MSIATEITRLQNAKAALKTAIENKGVTVPSATLIDGYASLVNNIQVEWENELAVITLATDANGTASDLIGATITIEDTTNNNVLLQVVWEGTPASVVITSNTTYSVSVSNILQYAAPVSVSYTAQDGSRNINFVYIKLQNVDLSGLDIHGNELSQSSTANSYVVTQAGSYSIPVVYGNGIKNGATNSAAYTRQGSTYTAEFVNHLGNTITSPYIHLNTDCTPTSAGLLWQTTSNMITSISLAQYNNKYFIEFTVNSIPTTNGLAVVYVKDSSNNIMWSWTLWCTTDTLSNITLVNKTNVNCQMLSEPFGAIWNSGRTKYVVPHYQFGRKDPMVPASAYNSNTAMTVYDISGNVYNDFGTYGTANDESSDKTVANAILNPNKFFTVYNRTTYNWNNLSYFYNYWNASCISTSGQPADDQNTAVKTIYDPSPTGYMLPAARFATGFTTIGSNSSESTEFNVIGLFSNGWTFKKDSEDTTGIYFPAAGSRSYSSSSLADMGSNSGWWTYAPGSQAGARSLYFYSSRVCPFGNDYRAYGFAVWAALELN